MRPLLSAVVLRSQTDERLAALARDGHNQAFAVIAQRYERELRTHARQLVPADRSEDVVQQAMLSGWSALRRGAEVREVRAWLHRIVYNAALRALQHSEDHDELSDLLPSAAATAAEVEGRFAARAAIAALAALPQAQRRALELTALQGRSGRDAAGALGISESALRQLVHRARTTLRAGATAITPVPLVSWAVQAGSSELPARIAEIGAGAGISFVAIKTAATVAVTATLIGGTAQLLSAGHAHVTPSQAPAAAAARGSAPGNTPAMTGILHPRAGTAAGASLPPAGVSDGHVRADGVQVAGRQNQRGQQQSRSSGGTGASGQSYQAGVDLRAPAAQSKQTGQTGTAGRDGTSNTGTVPSGSQRRAQAGVNQP